ncbi:MAG: hypothetical protein WCP70_09695 [Methanothrix sp.]
MSHRRKPAEAQARRMSALQEISRRRVAGSCGTAAPGYESRAVEGCREPYRNLTLISMVAATAP